MGPQEDSQRGYLEPSIGDGREAPSKSSIASAPCSEAVVESAIAPVAVAARESVAPVPCTPGYVSVGGKLLRCGFTTGTCATAAASAATILLCTGIAPDVVEVDTPAGITAHIDVEEAVCGSGWASCAVRKDAGDDPDVTDGCLVCARVERRVSEGVEIEGGEGVGRVTRPGLDQPVGAAAINRVPRQMIERAVLAALVPSEDHAGALVTISIPDGVALASRTFNPRLGIENGISVLGTSGIVRPMSEQALVSSIQLEMSMLRESGVSDLLVAPGNYGRDFARDELGFDVERCLQCSNYVGEALDEARRLGFMSVLVVGNIGKMAKVAAGIMNTHSRVADARLETISAHAALAGASRSTVEEIMESATTDAALDALDRAGLLAPAMGSLVQAVGNVLERKAAGTYRVGAVVFSNDRGLLGLAADAKELIALHGAQNFAKEE